MCGACAANILYIILSRQPLISKSSVVNLLPIETIEIKESDYLLATSISLWNALCYFIVLFAATAHSARFAACLVRAQVLQEFHPLSRFHAVRQNPRRGERPTWAILLHGSAIPADPQNMKKYRTYEKWQQMENMKLIKNIEKCWYLEIWFLCFFKNHVLASLIYCLSVSRYGDDFWKCSFSLFFEHIFRKNFSSKNHQIIMKSSSK